uniref:Uncharacterized protein n=1 Tax=Anguilla anguilla TaxID=7936 RepID=A0A0E9S0T6_ANGAN
MICWFLVVKKGVLLFTQGYSDSYHSNDTVLVFVFR